MNRSFWRDKRVLITGHSGFKGGWLSLWLCSLGSEVLGIGLAPVTKPSLFEQAKIDASLSHNTCDIRDAERIKRIARSFKPEIILHLAAQPLVRESYHDPLTTFSTNIMGTANVLEAIRGLSSVRVALFVTSDKVYRNLETPFPYRESDVLGGHDPYSASKAASELVISSYRDSFLRAQDVAVASARAGNVIGGGDWSEDRLIPDAVRAWENGKPLYVRNPDAIRPWQHVLEPLYGYLTLAEYIWERPESAGAFNFGPNSNGCATVKEVIELAVGAYGRGDVSYCLQNEGPHEANMLALETAKSRLQLGTVPRWSLQESVSRTMDWYTAYYKGLNARELCEAEIDIYESGMQGS